MKDNSSLSYKDAGVDIETGQNLVKEIKGIAKSTYTENILSSLGGFFSMCKIPAGMKEPILVSTTDGVGTKLCLAQQLDNHTTIGIDLVAMCVNELIVGGAQPLFFLDYLATGKLQVDHAKQIIAGIAEGCRLSGCSLTGGETAEMPGLYATDEYDLAGFCVGVIEKDKIIDGSKLQAGDKLIALASSGCHSNGYSLIRKIISQFQVDLSTHISDKSLSTQLLEPTRIYVKSILNLLQRTDVLAMAHITGGGLLENVPRILPHNLSAIIDTNSWQLPPIFQWIQDTGNISDIDMRTTFNLGVGMVVAVSEKDVATALATLQQSGEIAWLVGEVVEGDQTISFS